MADAAAPGGLNPCSRTSEWKSSFNFQYVQQLSNPRGSTATTGLSATSGMDVVPNTSPIRSGIPALRGFRTSITTTITFSKSKEVQWQELDSFIAKLYIYIVSVLLIQTSWLFTVKNDVSSREEKRNKTLFWYLEGMKRHDRQNNPGFQKTRKTCSRSQVPWVSISISPDALFIFKEKHHDTFRKNNNI